jgi:hypothetical protein
MTEISPPVRILLIAVVAFMATWMLFLRPKPEDIPPPSAPAPATQPGSNATSGPGKAVQEAANARAQADARSKQAEQAGEESSTGSKTSGSDKTAPAGKAKEKSSDTVLATTGLPARVRAAIGDRKVVALLFWNPRSSDDRAVRRALSGVDRHKGRVLAHATNVRRVATYQAITRGAAVEQSPTVVVIDRDRKVTTLVGYVDRRSIDQAIQEALRKS